VTKAKLISKNKAQEEEINQLKIAAMEKDFLIAQLQKMLFGAKSERFVNSVKKEIPSQQISLFQEIQAEALAKQEAKKTEEEAQKQTITYERTVPKKKTRATKRLPLPESLPRVEIVIEPTESTEGMVRIGEEVTEILDIIPPQFRVLKLIRPKYAHPDAKTKDINQPIIIAPMPLRVIDKGIPSTRLLAYLIINKFMDHLPYFRQIKIFQRIGVNLKSNTINGWMAKTCTLLKPLYDEFCKYHFSKKYLQADETTIKVLKVKKSGKKGKAHKGYYWVYFDPVDNHVVFIYDYGRGRKYPVEHLENFSGKLQVDGYPAYEAFDKLEHFTLYACMTHIRRKFVEALPNDKKRAEQILDIIQQIYAIEREARDGKYTSKERLALRQLKAVPLMETFKTYLDQQYDDRNVLPQSAIGKAVQHALRRWKYLERYLHDGEVEIDNNLVENAIRPVALGRKNYLFAGAEEGAKWGAMIYTLLGSAIRQGHDPLEYLSDILRRIPDMKISQLQLLFPKNWEPLPNNQLDLI